MPDQRGQAHQIEGAAPLAGSLAGSFGLVPTKVRRMDGPQLARQIEKPGKRDPWPEIPAWVDRRELSKDVRADLRGLSKQGAEFVADHLVAADHLVETEPELAWEHARAARSQGGRIAVVRETVGLIAYRTGTFTEVLGELRAARRMAGGPGLLAVMADTYRALGQPQRAIELSKTPEATQLDPAAAAELEIVAAGARADLGQHDAAMASLKTTAQRVGRTASYAYRVYYAYAAMLEQAGRFAEALDWYARAADGDTAGETDAAEKASALAYARRPGQGTVPTS